MFISMVYCQDQLSSFYYLYIELFKKFGEDVQLILTTMWPWLVFGFDWKQLFDLTQNELEKLLL